MANRAIVTTLAVALGATGCGEPSTSGTSVRIDTIAGVEVVTSEGPGAWAREGGAWQVDTTAATVIGELDGAQEYVFGQVTGVVVGGSGEIYVSDSQANEIRVYGADGVFQRRFGRAGEGPGEFGNISGLALAPEGVAAQDGSLNRVTVFDEAGDVVRSFRLQRPYMVWTSYAPMAFDTAGRFFDRTSLASAPGIDTIAVVAYGPDGSVHDTARIAGFERDMLMLERNGRPYMSVPRPFAPQPSFAFGPQGDPYFTLGAEYEVTRYAPGGEPVRTVRRPVERVAVTAAERDEALGYIEEAFAEAGGTLPANVQTPERKGAISRLVVDALDHLWVLTPSPADELAFRWSVHDPRGRFLGVVTTPVMVVTHIGESFVAGTIRDALGAQRVVVYPLHRP